MTKDAKDGGSMKKFPYPKGTLVRSNWLGFCKRGHVLVTTSEPKRNKMYESGYYQSATCLMCKVVVGTVDAGWWKELASFKDKARAREALESRIETMDSQVKVLEDYIGLLGAA